MQSRRQVVHASDRIRLGLQLFHTRGNDNPPGNRLLGEADSDAFPLHSFADEAIVHGDFANPVVLVDKVDKATVQHCDPTNALSPLLELV